MSNSVIGLQILKLSTRRQNAATHMVVHSGLGSEAKSESPYAGDSKKYPPMFYRASAPSITMLFKPPSFPCQAIFSWGVVRLQLFSYDAVKHEKIFFSRKITYVFGQVKGDPGRPARHEMVMVIHGLRETKGEVRDVSHAARTAGIAISGYGILIRSLRPAATRRDPLRAAAGRHLQLAGAFSFGSIRVFVCSWFILWH